MGMGIGAAMTGLRPIIEGMNMGFLLLAYNQISNNAGMLHYTSGGQFKVTCKPLAFCSGSFRTLQLLSTRAASSASACMGFGFRALPPMQLQISALP